MNGTTNTSSFLKEIEHLIDCFSDGRNFELAVDITNNYFDNTRSALAEHADDPFCYRHLIRNESMEPSVIFFDFKANAKLAIVSNKILIGDIGERVEKHLKEKYNYSYDGKNPPTFNP